MGNYFLYTHYNGIDLKQVMTYRITYFKIYKKNIAIDKIGFLSFVMCFVYILTYQLYRMKFELL